jgi:hypothetical protein
MKIRTAFAATATIAAALFGGLIAISFSMRVDLNVTPVEHRYGLADGYKAVAEKTFEAYPRAFSIAGDEDNSGKNVRLWLPVKAANGGKHLPNVAQQTGDCVSFGLANAIAYRIALHDSTIVDPFEPYFYGLARVTIGKNSPPCRSAGAMPSYAIEGFKRHGLLLTSEAGVAYSGRLADQWGCQGPPRDALDKARPRIGGDAYPIRSAAEARDAICNGYPLTVASDFGTRTIRIKDGRQVARWDDSWPHQMCSIGYDGEPSTDYFYILNSWGANAHPAPQQDEPPGGFWVDFNTFDRICRAGEVWAVNVVNGFEKTDLDWSVWDQLKPSVN